MEHSDSGVNLSEELQALKSSVIREFVFIAIFLAVLYIIIVWVGRYTLSMALLFLPGWALGVMFNGLVFTSRDLIELNALRKYLGTLKRKKIEDSLENGRDYYSIKRKGFLGLDGQGYNAEDEEAIEQDIADYCNR